MKTIKFFSMLLIAVALCIISSSCEKEEEHESVRDNNEHSEDTNHSTETPSTESIVRSNVKATYSYSDYYFTIKVHTTLKDHFPSATIRYGVEMGYANNSSEDEYQYYEYADNAYSNYKSNSSGTEFEFETCLFFGKISEYALFATSYRALKEKQKTTQLTASEKQLWEEITKMLPEKEKEVYSSYRCRLFAEINGKRYYVGKIR